MVRVRFRVRVRFSVGFRVRVRVSLFCPLTLHGPVTQKTTISNLNIVHFSYIVSLCYKRLCPHVRQHIALLFYIMLWSGQKCVAGNIMKNIIIIIIFVNCNWVVTRWQWLFYMYINMKKSN